MGGNKTIRVCGLWLEISDWRMHGGLVEEGGEHHGSEFWLKVPFLAYIRCDPPFKACQKAPCERGSLIVVCVD